jgi:hypothetical protein
MERSVYGEGQSFRYAGAMVWRPLASLVLLFATACNIVPSRVPLGETFPAGSARSLDGREIRFPDAFADGPVVLAIAYTDEADLDAERWRAALGERPIAVGFLRMHVTPGTAGILLAPLIEAGVRDRAEAPARASILNVCGELADRIATQTGMGRAELARVLLVARDGTIVWFCDTGFAPDRLDDLIAALGVTSR